MSRYNEAPADTDLHARIKLAPMMALEREIALNALRDAEVISDGIVWLVNAAKRLFAKVGKPAGFKPSFKH